MGTLASVGITASAAGNGILVLIALIMFAVAGILALIIKPVNWWAVLIAAALAIFMAALLVGP